MRNDFDLVVLGSGFAGSLLALAARRRGLRVLLVERGSHPRFVIGESTSPLTNLLLEELAAEYDLPELLPLAACGTWKQAYPDLPVGLKRGFTFYHHTAGRPFAPDPHRERQLLVAASPQDTVADTHWYRPAFDAFLVERAATHGVDFRDRTTVESVEPSPCGLRLAATRAGRSEEWRAAFLVDASGTRGALFRLLGLREAPLPEMPATAALFSHFTTVEPFAPRAGATGTPPYPPDDSALHHVFDGGWMWVLRFEHGVVSAGFAVEEWLARELGVGCGQPEAAWRRFLARYPSIGAQFAAARRVEPWFELPRLPFRCGPVVGPRWALLPSAAGFVDPLFSTGFPLALLGLQRLAGLLHPGAPPEEQALRRYAAVSARELETAARLVGGCYASFRGFAGFAALSMLYFAAASYSELARRLERPHLAAEFLLGSEPRFAAALARHTAAARAGRCSSLEEVCRDLAPFNVAGLGDPRRHPWYPVLASDAVAGAGLLEAAPAEVQALLERMGLEVAVP